MGGGPAVRRPAAHTHLTIEEHDKAGENEYMCQKKPFPVSIHSRLSSIHRAFFFPQSPRVCRRGTEREEREEAREAKRKRRRRHIFRNKPPFLPLGKEERIKHSTWIPPPCFLRSTPEAYKEPWTPFQHEEPPFDEGGEEDEGSLKNRNPSGGGVNRLLFPVPFRERA
jgi:hypothetical protein